MILFDQEWYEWWNGLSDDERQDRINRGKRGIRIGHIGIALLVAGNILVFVGLLIHTIR